MPPKKQHCKKLEAGITELSEEAGNDVDGTDGDVYLVFRETELKEGEGKHHQKNAGEDISYDQGAYHAPYRVCLHEKTPFLKDVLRESFRNS